ncbi:11752_t:CDS:2 [Cetraspora pellucida]|uniref:11752_t:CDS:1 n=1 Tax=Cetraspora pellucida TaxID=1433469 RepID=A0ACA9KQI6_9GLOM|nr:11752_t:CDS:2 [Cetraspora pellucida]
MSKAGIIFLKKSSVEDEIITSPKDYFYEYISEDKVEAYSKSNNYNGIPCFLVGTDLYRYTFYFKNKKILLFYDMIQFSITKPNSIHSYNHEKNANIFSKIDNILGESENKQENFNDIELDEEKKE